MGVGGVEKKRLLEVDVNIEIGVDEEYPWPKRGTDEMRQRSVRYDDGHSRGSVSFSFLWGERNQELENLTISPSLRFVILVEVEGLEVLRWSTVPR